jgi:hypothetical protein
MLIDHMKQGQSLFSFSAVINVNQDSLYEWEKRHPSFSEAIKAGRAQQANFWEKTGIKATHGKIPGFNATAFIWMTKNMLGWRDKQDIELSGKEGTPIQVQTSDAAQSLTDAELKKRLKDLLKDS